MKTKLTLVLAGTALLTQLAACRSDEVAEAMPVRAVKLETVSRGGGSTAAFVAIVRSERRAELSFEQGGRIASIQVDVGDRVRAGQVLATLDDEPLRLQLAQATAREHAARVQAEERRGQLAQQQAMFDDGAISAVTLATAKAALAAAEADSQAAVSERAIAARMARLAAIRAPFDGSVVARPLQPGMVVESGQAVLQVEGAGRRQAVADLPPAVAAMLKQGQAVEAHRSGEAVRLALRSVADQVGPGGTVQAIFELSGDAAHIRSGETLAISLGTRAAEAMSIPTEAILPEAQNGRGNVYVFHARTSMVERRAVKLGERQGGYTAIESGLAQGERVVTSGVTFLTHMQKVVPYQAETRLPQEAR